MKKDRESRHTGSARLIFGAIIILIGVWLLLRNFIPALRFSYIWPIIIIVIGAALVFRGWK
jgi:hypothetical protein